MTKMKKNLKFEILESVSYTNTEESVTHIDQKVRFTRGKLTHEARRVEIFYETKKPVVLLTNNFEFTVEDISEIYRHRWAIESLYKQLKQNFPLHFFYGGSVNAIQIQTWVVLIINLLITILSRNIKRHCAFSLVVTMYDLCLCTTLVLPHSWRNRRRYEMISSQKRYKKRHRNQLFSIKWA